LEINDKGVGCRLSRERRRRNKRNVQDHILPLVPGLTLSVVTIPDLIHPNYSLLSTYVML